MFKNNAFSLLDDDEINEVETKEENVKKNEDPLSKYYNIKQNVKKQEFNKNDPFKFNTLNKRKNNNNNTVQVQRINKKEIHENILSEKPNNYLKIYAKHLMDKDWNNISNYLNLEDINEWGDVPGFYNALKKNILRVKQFHIFVMKNNIYPLWEAEENRKGSKIKVRVNTIEETLTMMNTLTVYFLNNDILKEHNENLNAISFNPKKGMNKGVEENYYIVEVWLMQDLSRYKGNYAAICSNNITKLLDGHSVRIDKTIPEF